MFWPWESPSRSVRPLPSQLKTVNTFGRKRTPWTNDLFSTWRRGTSGNFYRITFFFLCWVLCGVCVWSTPQGLVIWGVKRYRDGLPFILQLTTGGPRLYWLLFPLKLIFMSLELVGMVWVRTSKQRSRFVATRPEQFQPVRTNLNLNLLCFSIVWLETWNSKLITFFLSSKSTLLAEMDAASMGSRKWAWWNSQAAYICRSKCRRPTRE